MLVGRASARQRSLGHGATGAQAARDPGASLQMRAPTAGGCLRSWSRSHGSRRRSAALLRRAATGLPQARTNDDEHPDTQTSRRSERQVGSPEQHGRSRDTARNDQGREDNDNPRDSASDAGAIVPANRRYALLRMAVLPCHVTRWTPRGRTSIPQAHPHRTQVLRTTVDTEHAADPLTHARAPRYTVAD